MPDEFVTLKLSKLFVGQMLDGLQIRVESWERTKDYLADGVIDPDDPYIEECSNENEAEKIANFYKEIIKEIETQLDAQSK